MKYYLDKLWASKVKLLKIEIWVKRTLLMEWIILVRWNRLMWFSGDINGKILLTQNTKGNIKSNLIKPESSGIILGLSCLKKRSIKQNFLEKKYK
jgi:hypothetical protein